MREDAVAGRRPERRGRATAARAAGKPEKKSAKGTAGKFAGKPAAPRLAPADRRRVASLLRRLARLYPDAHCTLDFKTPFQLYVATVLSAQCTDERVNLVTPELFARYPDARALAGAPREAIEALIRSTGFFRNKARSIQEAAALIVADHGGEVPATMEELLRLPGTGRKTANVILGSAFDTPGITVDTHVARVTRRLGWTLERDPVKIERDLMALIPEREWTIACHRLIQHGRRVCRARRPECETCDLRSLCPAAAVAREA